MDPQPIPLHSRASAHLFDEEDVIEFEDFFERNQEDIQGPSASIESLIGPDLFCDPVFDSLPPENEFPELMHDALNTIQNTSSVGPGLRPRGANGKLLVYSGMKVDEVPSYSFNFELTQLSDQVEPENAYCVGVFVKHGSSIIGQLDAFLIDREAESNASFSALCGHSDYVRGVVSSVCDDHGVVRYGNVDVLTASYHKTASRGGLLVLKSITVHPQHRCDDVGIRCVLALLHWLNTDAAALTATLRVSSTWSLALVAPLGQQGKLYPLSVRDRPVENNRVVQQFLRIGFQQTEVGSSVMYVTPARLQQPPRQTIEASPVTSPIDCSFISPWNWV